MKRLAATLNLTLFILLPATAWACMSGNDYLFVIGLMVAPFLALPYTLFGSAVIASQARTWFDRPFAGWFKASFGAYFACVVGGIAGFGAAHLVAASGFDMNHLESAIILSSPLVAQVAQLMWLHTRAQRRLAEWDMDVEPS